MWRCSALVLAVLVAAPVQRAAADDVVVEHEVNAGRRALAITAAVFPGIIVRGAGSYVVGEKHAARLLLASELGALLVAGAAGGLLQITNGSPYAMPATPIVVAGVGAFLTSWVEDIWIAAGGARVPGTPSVPPAWSLELGETWQHDVYRERLLQRAAGTVTFGRFGAGAAGLVDTNGESWLAFSDVRVRVIGDPACADCVVARVGGRLQRDRADQVTQLVGEVEIIGRLGLGRFDPAFHSNFLELSTGLGANRITYASTVSEVDALLLGRFAWGAYLPGGELTVYYDHRRDGLAGGIQAWRAAGFIGSFGANVDIRIDGPWALRGEFQIGNAYLSTLALAYRGGAR